MSSLTTGVMVGLGRPYSYNISRVLHNMQEKNHMKLIIIMASLHSSGKGCKDVLIMFGILKMLLS